MNNDKEIKASEEREMFADILSASLRKGLRILQLLMLVLAVIFLFSNIYWVEEGFVGIHCRFGKISGSDEFAVSPGGPYFALPAPIDRVIKIPTTMQNVAVDKAFWVEETTESANSGDADDRRENNDYLVPGTDGSLITGDRNLVQGQWAVDFQLDRAKLKDFINNISTMENARKLVCDAVEQAVVKVVAQLSVDDFIRGNIDNEKIKSYAGEILKKLDSGISINNVAQKRYTVPKLLLYSFQSVNRAESEKASLIERAKRYRSAALNEAAGRDFQSIIDAVNEYEKAVQAKDANKIAAADRDITDKFSNLVSGGEASQALDSARIYKTQTIEEVKGSAMRFAKLLEQHSHNPVILENRLLQDSLQSVFSGNVKTFYLPQDESKTIYLDINRQ